MEGANPGGPGLNCWTGDTPLATKFPALFSHTTRPHAQVAAVLGSNISLALVPRLSSCALSELASLRDTLASTPLSLQGADS